MTFPEAIEVHLWWDSLQQRSVGVCNGQEWANIWIGVMLRRYAEQHPDGVGHFRTRRAWAKVIEWQVRIFDHQVPEHFELKLDRFLRAGGNQMGSSNPWLVRCRSAPRITDPGGQDGLKYHVREYAIGRIRTLDENVAFEQDNLLKEQKRIRELSISEDGFDPNSQDISTW